MRGLLVLFFLTGCVRELQTGTTLSVDYSSDPIELNQGLEVEAQWDARCKDTFLKLEGGSKDPKFRIGSESVDCNDQKFSAKANCEPGPCAVIKGGRGGSRTLTIGFGKAGHHVVNLTLDNKKVRQEKSFEVDVYRSDALKLSCLVRINDTTMPCSGQSYPVNSEFTFRAEVYAQGKLLPNVYPKISSSSSLNKHMSYGLKELKFATSEPYPTTITARYDGIEARYELYIY